ncbi:MAG: hypothetical protein ACT4PT_03960 [Methanobacteriota archaeon]
MNVDVGTAVNIVGGLLVTALGPFVLTIRPRRRANVAFALFASAFGLRFVPANVALNWGLAVGPMLWLATAFTLVATFTLAELARTFPSRLGRKERRDAAIAVAFGGGVFLVIGGLLVRVLPALRATTLPTLAHVVHALAVEALVAALVGTTFLFALRFRRADARARTLFALLAAGLASYPAFVAGAGFLGNDSLLDAIRAGSTVLAVTPGAVWAAMVFVAFAWLRNAARHEDSKLSRNVALFILGTIAIGMAYDVLDFGNGGHGLARTAGVLLLAYAVVRHQLLGIDVKLRFAISKSTVAAVFIAVFFVASEAAQQFFGERSGSQYLGIVAAGALVFAIAPLSRLADRIAERAVPVAASPAAVATTSKAEVVYKAALRAALRDGVLTRREERHLAEIVRELAIDPVQAHDWRVAVEKETGGGEA